MQLNPARSFSAASLQAVYHHVSTQASAAVAWYLQARVPKKRWAHVLRVVAILAAATAGIMPMLSQIVVREDGRSYIAPVWASVCLGIAAAAVALDHFFGFSTAWMRYLATELQIRRILEPFQIDWEIERTKWASGTPNPEQTAQALSRCRTFLGETNAFIEQETNAWIAEFQSTLKMLDEAAKVKVEAIAVGAANLVVLNGEDCEDGWHLAIDEASPKRYLGKTAALREMVPGFHIFRVDGTIKGKVKRAEVAVSVPAGRIDNVEITLS